MAPNNKRVRRRPTAGTTATAAMALVALATSSPSFARGASHGRPPSIKKAPNKKTSKTRGGSNSHNSNNNNNNSNGGHHSIADAAVAAQGFFGFGASQNDSNNGGGSSSNSNGGKRVVVVQPENLQGSSAHVGSASRYQQSNTNTNSGSSSSSQSQSGGASTQQQQGGGDVQLHAWPHPDTFQANDASQQQPQNNMGAGTDFAGDRAPYGRSLHRGGHSVEYYQNGELMQQSSSSSSNTSSGSNASNNNNNSNNNGSDEMDWQQGVDAWIEAQQQQNSNSMGASSSGGMHVANYSRLSQEQPQEGAKVRGQSSSSSAQSSIDINYETWLENQSKYQQEQPGQVRGASSSSSSSSSGQMDFETWLANQGSNQVQQQAQGGSAPTDYQAWMQSQGKYQQQQQAQGGSAPTDYQAWMQSQGKYQQQQPTQGSSASSLSPEELQLHQHTNVQQRAQQAQGASQLESSQALPSPAEDLDMVAGKQVILRPRLSNNALKEAGEKPLSLPPMGSTSQSTTNQGDDTNNGGPVVYYYDPLALFSNNKDNNELEAAPELSLPDIVYDSSGHALKLEQVHAGGRNEVFLEVKPKAVWGSDFSSLNDRLTNFAVEHKLAFNPLNGDGGNSGAQSQDQLIVLFTVATMAIMVGALSAKRLRSRKLLESCMHPELDDEDWEVEEFGSVAPSPRYDKKFDVDTGRSVASSATGDSHGGSSGSSSGILNGGAGFGALMGGRSGKGAAGYYGTNDPGGLHWRGDMEKFDV